MKIRNDLPESFYDSGFTNETDPFSKRDLAERLTKLYKDLTQGTVAIIDGRWGIGKSVFSKQWKKHLEGQGVPCIYFDAFATDYISDPFRAVATAFVRAAKDAKSKDSKTYNRFMGSLSKATKIIAAPTAKMAVKAVTLGMIGSAELDDFKAAAEEMASGIGDMSESAIKSMLEEQAGNEANFEALRSSLADLPGLLAKKLSVVPDSEDEPSSKPSLVVIIDELDRCRPDFALGVLEVLKHFFRAERVHFVLVTNLAHLRMSVERQYGVGEAAGEYLQKFYDFIVPFEGRSQHHQSTNASLHASRQLQAVLPGSNSADGNDLINDVSQIIRAYDLSLRQAERIVTNVVLAQIDFNRRTYRPGILVALLAAIKALDPALFGEIKRSRLDPTRLLNFVNSGEWSRGFYAERLPVIIRYHSEQDIDENDEVFRGYGSSLGTYNFSSRLDILPYLANAVIDRFG